MMEKWENFRNFNRESRNVRKKKRKNSEQFLPLASNFLKHDRILNKCTKLVDREEMSGLWCEDDNFLIGIKMQFPVFPFFDLLQPSLARR